MNIQELEEKHKEIIGESDLNIPEYLHDSIYYDEEEASVAKEATKLSIEFAISVLEEFKDLDGLILSKIQEFKTYLDEK